MRKRRLPNTMRARIRNLLSQKPQLTPRQIEKELNTTFDQVHLKAVSALKRYFLRNGTQESTVPVHTNKKSNLSVETHNKIKEMLKNNPSLTAMGIARRLEITNVREIKSISNICYHFKHKSNDNSSKEPVEKVVRSYHRKSQQVIYFMRGMYSTIGLPAKAKAIINQIEEAVNRSSGLRIVKLAGKERISEIREMESTPG
jgi:hypothetical protein